MKKLIASVALLAAVAAPARAQSTAAQAIDDVRKNAKVHAGPLYLSPGILLKELGVDTNVFNEAGEQKTDFTFTLTPKLDAWVPIARRALLSAAVESDFVWYAKYDTERSVDPQAALRADIFLHRIRLFAEGTHVNTRQRPNFEIDVRSRHIANGWGGGIEYQITPKFSVEAAGHRSEVSFDGDVFFLGTSLEQTLNRVTTSASVTARHRATPLTTIVVKAEQLRDEFEFSTERNADSVRVLPGVEFKPRALISGSAYVGFRRFEPRHNTMPEYTGLVAQLGLSYTLLGATTFGVSYARDVQYSFEPRQPYYIVNGVGASVRQALGARFDVMANVDRSNYDYRDLLVLEPAVARADLTWAYGATLGYRLGRSARIGAGFTSQERQSNTQQARDYRTTRFVVTVSYGL